MAVVSVVSYKGGVGKTTTAVHLAALLSARGAVALVDGDPNHSSALWAGRGELPFEVVTFEKMLRARGFDHIVVDSAARPNGDELKDLAESSDVMVIPSNPEGMSIDALSQTCKTLEGLGEIPYRALLTMVPPAPSREGSDARAFLEQSGVPLFAGQVRQSAAFRTASTSGVLVYQVRSSSAKNCWMDYEGVGRELWTLLESR